MKNCKVVFLTSLSDKVVEEIISFSRDDFEVIVLNNSDSEDKCISEIKDCQFLLCHGKYPTDAMLNSAKKCQLVQLLAAGFDQMNLPLLDAMQIPLANNGGANSWAVSDHAVLLMLALYKKLIDSDKSTREGTWKKPINGENTYEMANKKVGILGIGNIGKKVARRVQAFDSKVQYYDLFPLDFQLDSQLDLNYVSLDELFETSDIITSHMPLNDQTFHMINADRLSQMKNSSILINTSRGEIIDEKALIYALNNNEILGAGLDVFETEPVQSDNPLLKMDNVIVTPHVAGTTWDTWARRSEFAFNNMIRIIEGEKILGQINS
ncbi:MAG: 2-hydroxyacid dehydrogenase [Dehalococcoidia bacterium]